jgi:hypothetical protein
MNKVRLGSNRAKIWKAIRALGKFDATEITVISGADHSNVKRYLRILLAAGYLRIISQGRKNGNYTYRLIKDTGIKPPVQKEIRLLYDPNTNEYWVAGSTIDQFVEVTVGNVSEEVTHVD